ncbi:helix-turn-helix transcriptional regulator [Nonomuraea sp. NPDC050310]|uniref:helix-turn-helix domain-containing protein n=1 Tax=Nonomuraea sp. NPDC050310 TaxID=3154935 RepID=UPI0033DAA2EF
MRQHAKVRFGKIVKHRREELGLSQTQASRAGGPSVGVLSRIENGKLDTVTTRIAAALDRALQWEPGSAQGVLAAGCLPKARSTADPGQAPALAGLACYRCLVAGKSVNAATLVAGTAVCAHHAQEELVKL